MTFAELWCRSYDEMYVSLSRARELAFHSGFTGQRAERTWAEKVRKLAELGFISVKQGQAGPLSHALILNPYLVIKRLHESGHSGISQEKYNALVERAIEIGATDLDDDYADEEVEQTAPQQAKASKSGSTARPQPSAKLKILPKPKAKVA